MKLNSNINLQSVSASKILQDVLDMGAPRSDILLDSSYASHALQNSLTALSNNLNQLDEMTSKLAFLQKEIRYVLKK